MEDLSLVPSDKMKVNKSKLKNLKASFLKENSILVSIMFFKMTLVLANKVKSQVLCKQA